MLLGRGELFVPPRHVGAPLAPCFIASAMDRQRDMRRTEMISPYSCHARQKIPRQIARQDTKAEEKYGKLPL
ncbi:hypothetical protein J6590_030887 [Homalodisca vitripennis]|nr:hypothetical protein J6590_030887 [Homalodisca vitripennis]